MKKWILIASVLLVTGSARAEVVGHPAGCPRVLFCGCGAAIEVFGKPLRELWHVNGWFKFPRSMPASGMAAVSRRHVFVLRQHVKDDIWLVYDANSGRGLTQVHNRSIRGYTIVNPHGSRGL